MESGHASLQDLVAGLKGHRGASAYVVLSSDYKQSSGEDGWKFCHMLEEHKIWKKPYKI